MTLLQCVTFWNLEQYLIYSGLTPQKLFFNIFNILIVWYLLKRVTFQILAQYLIYSSLTPQKQFLTSETWNNTASAFIWAKYFLLYL